MDILSIDRRPWGECLMRLNGLQNGEIAPIVPVLARDKLIHRAQLYKSQIVFIYFRRNDNRYDRQRGETDWRCC